MYGAFFIKLEVCDDLLEKGYRLSRTK